MKRLIRTVLSLAFLASIFLAVPSEAQIGLTASASQSPATVRPGQANVAYFRLQISTSVGSGTLTSLTLTNATTGTGDQTQRDSELGSLRLYIDDGDGNPDPTKDTLVPVTPTVVAGKIRFAGLNVPIQDGLFGATNYLHVIGNVPLLVRDGDALDLMIQAASDMTFQSGNTAGGTYPLDPVGNFPVDGMVAAQISVNPVPTGSILAGTQNVRVLELVLPANGYEADQLQDLRLLNEGTASAGSDITSLRAWVDGGDGIFDPQSDRLLGSLAFSGGFWRLTGLTEPVPAGGIRLFFGVDIGDLASEGRTIRLALPATSPFGVGMISGNDGPIDAVVRNPNFQTISAADRVTFTTSAVGASVVNPGDTKVQILHVLAKNTYSTAMTLSSLTITNTTSGSGSQSDRDGEVSLTLRGDGNNNGALNGLGQDPVLGTAVFSNGKATFSGFAWTWNPGQTRHLFVTADVSVTGAKDPDVLSLNVSGPLDVDFGGPTRAVAAWPLDSGARLTVDGMLAAQVTNVGAPVATVGPGDGPILALDVKVPRNGYASDLLDSLIVENRGDAVTSDIAELRLWRDGGDGTFSGGSGDDRDLGLLTFSGGRWRSTLLVDTLAGVDASASHYFVGLTVSASPRDSATVRLAIPVGGIVVRSANDGPIDSRIANPQTITISNSPILVTMQIDPAASTVGQQVGAFMVVRNVGSESLNGVVPSALAASGAGALTLASGPSPASFNLAPAASDTFRWTYTASGPGDVMLTGHAQGTGATSGLVRGSVDATSNTHQVFQSVSSIDYTAASSMPATVSRGQTDVIPLSLTFTNNGGAQAASVRLSAFRIRVEDGTGAGIVPSDLLTAVAVNSGTTVLLRKTALESTGAEVQLTLASPVTVDAAQSATLSLRLDISPSATTSDFRLVISDSTWFAADDVNSGAPVNARLQGSTYPVRSGLGRLVSEALRLDAAAVPGPPARVGRGEAGVPLLTLRVENPGQTGFTSDVRISTFEVTVSDTNGVAVPHASDYLGRIRVRTALQTLLSDRIVYATDGSTLTLVLSPPLTVPVNTPLDVFLTGDVATSAQLGAFQTLLGDSAAFAVTDASTGERVPAVYATTTIVGPAITVESAADTLAARGTPRFPPQVTVGKSDVAALAGALRHPDLPGAARIRVDSLYVQCRDELRRPLTPAAYLDALRVLWNGVEIASVPNPPSSGGTIGVALPSPMLEPGDTDSVDIRVDISAAAPAGYLELAVFAGGIRAADANTSVPTTVAPESGTEFPLTSGLTRLVPPARDLVVSLESRMPATLAADGDTITVGTLTLRNVAAASSDSIFLDHLTVRAGDRDFRAIAFGAAASGAVAYVSGVPWAWSAALTADSTEATLVAGSLLGVPPSGSVVVELRAVVRQGATPTTFRVGSDAAGIGVVQPSSALLQIQVQPAPGSTFPMWTEAGSFGGLTLGDSYSNYPNPFAGGRQATTFAFYLRQAGRVTLRIVTPGGDGVATLLDNAARPAGMNQSDLWDGRNGVGRVVRNGVYIAELTVKFDGGSHDRVIRKVAVVR